MLRRQADDRRWKSLSGDQVQVTHLLRQERKLGLSDKNPLVRVTQPMRNRSGPKHRLPIQTPVLSQGPNSGASCGNGWGSSVSRTTVIPTKEEKHQPRAQCAAAGGSPSLSVLYLTLTALQSDLNVLLWLFAPALSLLKNMCTDWIMNAMCVSCNNQHCHHLLVHRLNLIYCSLFIMGNHFYIWIGFIVVFPCIHIACTDPQIQGKSHQISMTFS